MIYIIRHGETEMNSRHALQGRSDYPLNRNGIAQAERVASLLKEKGIRFDAVYSSPLLRALQTAGILAPHVTPVTDARLIEMDYGPYEGMDLYDPSPEVLAFFRDFTGTPAPRGMETLQSVSERTEAFVRTLSKRRDTILISTHAIAMKGILESFTPDSHGSYWSRYIGNCLLYGMEWNGEAGFSVPVEIDLE